MTLLLMHLLTTRMAPQGRGHAYSLEITSILLILITFSAHTMTVILQRISGFQFMLTNVYDPLYDNLREDLSLPLATYFG
jgi:hypothetical protein